MICYQPPQKVLQGLELSRLGLKNDFTYGPVYCHSKIIDEILPIEEVIRSDQEIPRKRSKPRKTVDTVNGVPYIDNFLETFNLYD